MMEKMIILLRFIMMVQFQILIIQIVQGLLGLLKFQLLIEQVKKYFHMTLRKTQLMEFILIGMEKIKMERKYLQGHIIM